MLFLCAKRRVDRLWLNFIDGDASLGTLKVCYFLAALLCEQYVRRDGESRVWTHFPLRFASVCWPPERPSNAVCVSILLALRAF